MQNRTLPYFLILPSLLLAAVVIFWPVVHLFEIATHDVNRFGQLREFNDGANSTMAPISRPFSQRRSS
ncbi:sugar ABC transporter permease [Brucella vulpis]|nr:sugar ABC transporter permease [Brucella vulpis]CUW51300.1 sugar ABC transporter permease [Brucella vulpis]